MLIINLEYNEYVDFNLDQIVDILDLVLLIDFILD